MYAPVERGAGQRRLEGRRADTRTVPSRPPVPTIHGLFMIQFSLFFITLRSVEQKISSII